MFQSHLGEFAALTSAVFWAITALAFHRAVNNVGSLVVNFVRLVMAVFLLGALAYFLRGKFWPTDAGSHQWIWLSLSGLIGFVIGDYTLFKSYQYIEARISMLIMALAPPIAFLIGWMLMDEQMTVQNLFGMVLTLTGISMVILSRNKKNESKKRRYSLNYSLKGLVLALIGAVGQAVGLVLSKYGMADYDAIAATHIRVIVATVIFAVIVVVAGKMKATLKACRSKSALPPISLGAFFGPFLGVYFSLLAVKFTTTGIASTIMAIVPVLIIPPAIFIFKEKVSFKEFIGAVVAVLGVMFFFVDIPFL